MDSFDMLVALDNKHIQLEAVVIFLMNFGTNIYNLLVIKIKYLSIYNCTSPPQLCSMLNA